MKNNKNGKIKISKKILITLGGILFILIVLPIVSKIEFTSEVKAATYGDYEYKVLDNGTVEITRYTKGGPIYNDYINPTKEISIPEKIDGKKVTSIGNNAFKCCNLLKSIKIPDGITRIGKDAFYECIFLESINIPNGITEIYSETFMECRRLTSINIPNGVTKIGFRAFDWCDKLESITIPDSVEIIGGKAFGSCSSLKSIKIPERVTEIGFQAFEDCSSLKSIKIPKNVAIIGYGAFWGCDSLTRITIPNSVTCIESNVFAGCNSLTSIEYNGNTYLNQWRKANEEELKKVSKKLTFKRLDKPKISKIIPSQENGVKTIKDDNSNIYCLKKDSKLILTLKFAEEISKFDSNKISVSGAKCTLKKEKLDSTEYKITITGGAGKGKIKLSIDSGFVMDPFGNKSTKSIAASKINIILDNNAPTVSVNYDESSKKRIFEIKDASQIAKYQIKIYDENGKEKKIFDMHKPNKSTIHPSLINIDKYCKVTIYVEDILGNSKTYTDKPYIKTKKVEYVGRTKYQVTYKITTDLANLDINQLNQLNIKLPDGCTRASLKKNTNDKTGKSLLLKINVNNNSKSGKIIIPEGKIYKNYKNKTGTTKSEKIEIDMDNTAPTISLGKISTSKQRETIVSFYLSDTTYKTSGVKKYRISRLDKSGKEIKIIKSKLVKSKTGNGIIQNLTDNIKIIKNDKYRLTVWDYQGNVSSKDFTINNIDRVMQN